MCKDCSFFSTGGLFKTCCGQHITFHTSILRYFDLKKSLLFLAVILTENLNMLKDNSSFDPQEVVNIYCGQHITPYNFTL